MPRLDRRPRVYCAGPYSGDVPRNMVRAISVGSWLWRAGYAPFVPHLSMTWDLIHPMDYEEWIDFCCQWVAACDAVYRLEGASPGADREVEFARSLGIPVFGFAGTMASHFGLDTAGGGR